MMSPDDTATEKYLDVLYSTLSHPHRRIALRYLLRQPRPVPVTDLAAEIALVEAGASGTPASPVTDDVASLVSLRHVHLPKLLDADLIELDPATDTVTLSARAGDVPLDSAAGRGLLDPSSRSENADST
ncbi:DUF7344 domain-containing protein [Halorussus sp. AFM4]|uniref:DUF7344 domain-containing protein n=1 Tax=Halorussus sp. AFM4 TaxID=3421651 RepID=UPI003EBC9D54